MRAVTFKSVLDSVLRRLRLDPANEALTHDTARGATEHINTRLEMIWTFWPWKELEKTTKRAFRPFWDVATPYFIGDEFYVPGENDAGVYYHTKIDTAAGVNPAVSINFYIIAVPLYRAIPFRQAGQQEMGQVLGAWPSDPHTESDREPYPLQTRQTESGVEILSWCHAFSGGVVWLSYRPPVPKFTTVPVAEGKSYAVGDIAYFPLEGECKKVVTAAIPDPPTAAVWSVIEFPALFEPYVKLGAYADALAEVEDESLNVYKVQLRQAAATRAEASARSALEALCDRQLEQGDRPKYHRLMGRRRTGYYGSLGYCAAA